MIRQFPSYPQGIRREVGIKVAPYDHGPPALRPSSMNPKLSRSVRGRQLAGSPDGIGDIDNINSEGIDTYPNELDVLAAADDVAGNGVFDPNLSHGNVHPDAGVFAEHLSLPGYVARDKFYAPSEVMDITTGQPVEYVPSGAVAFQEGQVETLQQIQELYATPPGSEWKPRQAARVDTWIPQEFSMGVGADPTPTPTPTPVTPTKEGIPVWVYGLVGVGAGVGLMYLVQSSKRGR